MLFSWWLFITQKNPCNSKNRKAAPPLTLLIHPTHNETKMEQLNKLTDCITALVTRLEVNVDDDELKQTLVENITDLSTYACLQQEHKCILNSLIDYLMVLYFRVGELNYKSVECVLDALTMACVAVQECIDT